MGRRQTALRALAAFVVVVVVGAGTMILMSRDGAADEVSAAPCCGTSSTSALVGPAAIVVRARNAESLDNVSALATSLGYAVTSRIELPPALVVEVPAGVTLAQAVTDFTSKPGVLYAEPAFPVAVADAPTDPLYASHERDYLEKMSAPAAWDITTGSPGIIVAVLDTGVDVTHPDLQGRIWANPREIAGNGIDDDADGCVDDVNGCAFLVNPDPSCSALPSGAVTDDLGHGTFVAGIIAASGDGLGMVGIARNTTLLPVKILDCKGSGNTLALAQGILYAAQHGARILNVSLGGEIQSEFVRETIRVARDEYGAQVIAATGNNGGGVSYPARYDSVLAVGGATSSGNERAGFSNSGPEVDVVAMSIGIVGPVPPVGCALFNCLENNPGYALGDGTSFAAPMASGLAALILARNPFLSPDAIVGIIRNTADPVGASDRPDWAGAGRINMLRALQLPFRLGAPGSTRS